MNFYLVVHDYYDVVEVSIMQSFYNAYMLVMIVSAYVLVDDCYDEVELLVNREHNFW